MEDSFSATLLQNIFKFKIPIALAVLGIFFVSMGVISPSLNQSGKKQIAVEHEAVAAKDQTKLKVDVSGAVKNPGVYSLDKEARVVDAINSAGGFATGVNQEWVSKNLNLAARLTDGQKVFVAPKGEQTVNEVLSSQSVTQTSLININTASSAELDTLPGVGTVTANKIIASRPYQSTQELLDKKVVNTSTFNKIKDLISVY